MLDAAVRNNAAWVATMHAAHGHAGELGPDLWLTHGTPLPFYPNAVTLTFGPDAQEAQLARLRALVAGRLPVDWGIKDSHAALDLAPMGFTPVFEAEWIARQPRGTPATDIGVRWLAVREPQALIAWERAWSGEPSNASADEAAPLFLPALLADPDVAVLGGYATRPSDAAPVAGLIVNRSGEGAATVAGVSNLFLPAEAAGRVRASALAAAEAAFPGLPLVGYDRGPELEAMCAEGFEPLGPLRVWEYAGGKPGS